VAINIVCLFVFVLDEILLIGEKKVATLQRSFWDKSLQFATSKGKKVEIIIFRVHVNSSRVFF